MASPAASLLAAFNGKLSSTPGSGYGGYNPFTSNSGAGSASQPDPGQQAQNDTAQSQANYLAQQDANRTQLQTSLAASSVGGGVQQGNQSTGNADAQRLAQFNSLIQGINQSGLNATQTAQAAQQNAFSQKLSGLSSDYTKNLADASNWLSDQVSQIQLQSAQNANGASLGFDQLGQLIPTGADPNSNIGARAVAIAQQVVKGNVPYVYGGNSLTQGVDCSGLVQQVYARLGIQLPRTSTEQARYGKIVPNLQSALPGDLILMYSPYEPAGLQQYGHVGIYIGNGMMIDAAHTGTVVRIEPILNMTRIVRPW